MKTIIRFTIVYKKSRRTEPCWLASVSYADGPGMKVKRMTTTRDRLKAARFGLATAHAIAEQFSQYPAALEHEDGTPMPAETVKLLQAQRERHAAALKANADVRAEFEKALREILPPALLSELLTGKRGAR